MRMMGRVRKLRHLMGLRLMDSVHTGTEPAVQGTESIELAFANEYWSIFEAIESAETIAISGHTSPDGDALGSTLGLGLALRGRFPRK